MTDTQLPTGVHPRDNSKTWTGQGEFDANVPVGGDRPAPLNDRTRKPFGTENEEALPVNQRSAYAWSPRLIIVSSDTPVLVAGRQKGRQGVSLWVPTSVIINGTLTTTPAGVMIGSDPQEATSAVTVMNVGDSIRIQTEGAVFAALVPGTAAGYLQVIVEVNPPGGELGIY